MQILTVNILFYSEVLLANIAIASPMSTEEKLQTFQTLTEYSSDDLSTANAAWAKFVVNGFVALPQSWVADSQWPAAREMPGDEEKGIYVVDGFHQLHCVVYLHALCSSNTPMLIPLQMHIRNTMSDLLNGKPVQNYTHTLRHLNHCYDALRQAIICRADDTPLYVPLDTFFAGNGQQRRCRNWDALEDWVVRHTACYDPVRC